MERATTQLLQENEELKEKLQVAKEKEEENARTKASNSETIARKRLENEQLKDQLTVESERVEREMIEVQNDFAQANETLQVERNAFTNALNKLKETVPRSSAVIAQIQALQSSIDSTQLHRWKPKTRLKRPSRRTSALSNAWNRSRWIKRKMWRTVVSRR